MLVVEHTVAVSLKVGIRYLISELLADALVLGCLFKSAGAIAASFLEALLYYCYDILIFV